MLDAVRLAGEEWMHRDRHDLGAVLRLFEFFGGIALIVGLLTRLAGLGLAFVMLGAILFVHLRAGLFLPNRYEFALSLLGAVTFLVLAGAGSYSLDALIERRRRVKA